MSFPWAAILKKTRQTWTVARPQPNNSSGISRVSARVCGSPLWFESPSAELVPAIEAWASALVLPAAACGKRLQLAAPVDPVWLDNSRQLSNICTRWWNDVRPFALDCVTQPPPLPSDQRGVGLFFTGGVDSFHSLITERDRIDALIYVEGFDIDLADRARCQRVSQQVREVASAFNKQAIIVRTNLRHHSCLRRPSWIFSHGGALAAVGHVLSGVLSRVLISPSFSHKTNCFPWGSHPETDHYRGSRLLAVEHLSTSEGRMERLLEIAHEPAVWKFLRVCWKNNSQELNCGRCEKCVRTMVSLAAAGVLPKCETFPGRDELPARIESLTNLHPNEYLFWDQIAEANLPTELLRSVDVLRQRKPAHPPQRRPRQFA